MSDEEHLDSGTKPKGVYQKKKWKYRKNCKKGCEGGFHGHYWQAHHILPYHSFNGASGFVMDCLLSTKYDINEPYSMGGLPHLHAYVLYCQKTMPAKEKDQFLKDLRCWGTKDRDEQKGSAPVQCPKYPVHNPSQFGHPQYTQQVTAELEAEIFEPLRESAKNQKHPKVENVRQELVDAKKKFWSQLKGRQNVPGAGGTVGVEANLKKRYEKDSRGWWQPISMTDVDKEPATP